MSMHLFDSEDIGDIYMTKEIHGGNIYKYDKKMYDFSANLNPLGMPEACKEAIVKNILSYENYPDPFNRELKKAMSDYMNLPEEYFCFGNGAADIIFRITLAFKPRKALIAGPTFAEYRQALEISGCETVDFLMSEEEGFCLYADRLTEQIGEDTDMLFICNPNNPTGIPVSKEDMLKIAKACEISGTVLVVDECFSDFIKEEEKYSILENIQELGNTIILKAFTKIYAMAGLRLGFSICSNKKFTEKIEETLQPWSVSTVASKAGCAALQDRSFVEKTKKYIEKERNYLIKNLCDMGIKTYDSAANYIFFRCEKDIIRPLLEKKILIRSCGNYIGLDDSYYRIAVRTHRENEIFVEALEDIVKKDERG